MYTEFSNSRNLFSYLTIVIIFVFYLLRVLAKRFRSEVIKLDLEETRLGMALGLG